MKDRALTEEQKKEVLAKLLECWMQCPEMRLGQLIENARIWHRINDESPDLFYIEDYKLVNILGRFIKMVIKKTS